MKELEFPETGFSRSLGNPSTAGGWAAAFPRESWCFRLQIELLLLTTLRRTPTNLESPRSMCQASIPLIKPTEVLCHSGIDYRHLAVKLENILPPAPPVLTAQHGQSNHWNSRCAPPVTNVSAWLTQFTQQFYTKGCFTQSAATPKDQGHTSVQHSIPERVEMLIHVDLWHPWTPILL